MAKVRWTLKRQMFARTGHELGMTAGDGTGGAVDVWLISRHGDRMTRPLPCRKTNCDASRSASPPKCVHLPLDSIFRGARERRSQLTDYRLDALSPRLFEHMVQALAIGAITSTTTPFGDGPDGGREATFEGPTHYGAEGNRWNGYGIIQAKYHLSPRDTTSNTKWACTELKKELKQYTRQTDPRPTPRYYIFAVNVTLSAAEGGGKDQVRQILAEFGKDKEFEFDIWDYDKLRVLIDRDQSVRKSYMAWITSSDVLAELCEYLGARKKDYYKIILRYLQRELLADQYARLEQAGHSADEAIPLSQVFIDLPTSFNPAAPDTPRRQDEPLRFVSRVLQESSLSLREKDNETRAAKPNINVDAMHQGRIGRSVLIGGPGQGKTTVAQYICQIFRCALLKDIDNNLLDPDVKSTLRDLMAMLDAEEYPMPSARRLPFRIVLSDFAKKLAAGEVKSFMGYLAAKLCSNTDISISAQEVEQVLSDYPTIIILDGLDEVPSSTNRDDVIRAVSNFSIDVATGNLDTYLIATTRPQGYNEEFSPGQYIHHYLVPLNSKDALEYGNKLARIRFGANQERFNKVVDRLIRAIDKPATARLMQTPLQVTILTLLVDRMGDPPEERWSLFREYYQLIYDRETERDIVSVRVLKEHRVDVDVIHRRVGIALQVESERSGGTDARLTLDQFGKIVDDYLIEEGHSGTELQVLKQRIIDAAANRLVFLVGLEAGRVGFEIRSLQEFMAAEGITDGSDEMIRNRLRAIASSSHWRNVFLFAAGKCFSDRRYLRDTIQSICAELNDDESDESLRIMLVGSALALDLLEDGPARRTPFTRGTLTRLALQLLGTPFRDVVRIAGVCEDSTRSIYLEDLRDRLGGEASPSSKRAWECLSILVDRYGGEFEELARDISARRPMTDEEFDAVVDVATGSNEWLSQTLFEVVKERAPVLSVGMFQDPDSGGIDQTGPWISPPYPNWLTWYSDYCNTSFTLPDSRGFQLIGTRKRRYFVVVNRLREARYRTFIAPSDLPNTDSWEFVWTLSRFMESPNAVNLAEAARMMKARRSKLQLGSMMAYQVPWPLSEVMRVQAANPDCSLAEVIESGAYGDTEEWSALEDKLDEGITISWLMESPLIKETSDGGLFLFPFRTSTIMSGFSAARNSGPLSGPDLVNAFDQAENPVIKRFFCEMLLRGADLRTAHINTWADRVLYFRFSHTEIMDHRFYLLLDKVDLRDPKWSKLFAGFSTNFYFTHTFSGPTSALVNMRGILAAGGPQYSGLLIPLAAALPELPRDLRSRIMGDQFYSVDGPPAQRMAAIMVNIMMGYEVGRFEKELHNLFGDHPDAFQGIVAALQARELPYRQERDELMDLIHIANRDRTSAWNDLGKNFQRRPSKLLEAGAWERLQLPSTMRAVLDLDGSPIR